ncbi:secretion protein EccK [Mycolicibacterium porcinum]|nr:secretion protein EccK [Mycolicibacterium porcinum]
MAPVPVSAARQQRDAVSSALRRESGTDPLTIGRRIAAALNAPDMVNQDEDFFFHWITAVTQDGRIVVANNYAMAYMPEQVRLPDHVVMASADESIPASERARWATYPIVALQNWAQHHEVKLRALIALEQQFTSDSGVPHVVLTPEDIPASGKMAGRDRLQVIAPEVSSRLARISDADLVTVLPPAPVDANPPDEDERLAVWDRVWQPVISPASNRGEAHLQAFLNYALYAQEHALYDAHTTVDVQDQRRAVDGFIYWQHVGQLTADALEG